jgi:nucleotide-binding universal stress UspA family protein
MLSGIYKEAKQGLMVTMNAPYHSPEVRKNFLLFIDGSPACLYAANYFAQVFGKVQGIGVTLLWIFKGQDTDFFETLEELQKVDKEAYLKGEEILNQARGIIVQGGVNEGDISIKKAIADKKTGLSDKLMEELKNGGYDTIVLAKRPKTKSQEFIFGSTTVKMVRDAAVHVLAVKVPDNLVAGEKNG